MRRYLQLFLAIITVMAAIVVDAAVTVNVNGTSHTIPQTNEKGWGASVTAWIQAISSNTLQPNGGSFTLTNNVDFGATYGVKSQYYLSRTLNPSTAGVLRLGNTEAVGWRNAANSANLLLSVNSSNVLTFDGVALVDSGSLAAAIAGKQDAGNYITALTGDVTASGPGSATATIASGAVTDAKVSASAAISYSKLALTGGIVNADVNASAAIARSKIETVTPSKALVSDGSGLIASSAVSATELGYLTGTTSAVQTQIDTKLSSSALTTHAALGTDVHAVGVGNTIVGTGTTQTLTAKTLTDPVISDAVRLTELGSTPSTPASGFKKLYAKTDGKVYTINSSGTEAAVGSGAGGGGINYITNTDAETDATGYAVYADAAGALPVDGTGGSPTVTLTRSTSAPLRGLASFVHTKTAVNSQGQGSSYSFTVDTADTSGETLTISFDYSVLSGTYVTGDIGVYIQDTTNNTIIQPSGFSLSSVTSQPFRATFQTTASTSYRLILHTASVSALAYAIKLDNVSVSPQAGNIGSINLINDSVSFTPTAQNLGTLSVASANDCTYARIAQFMDVSCKFTLGTITSGSQLQFNLPSSLVVDSTLIPAIRVVGEWQKSIATASSAKRGVLLAIGGQAYVTYSADDYTNAINPYVSQNAGTALSNSEVLQFRFRVPIQGWATAQVINPNLTPAYAGKQWLGASASVVSVGASVAASNTRTTISHAGLATYTLIGSASNDASTNLQVTASLPAGEYEVEYSGFMRARTNAAGTSTYCVFELYDGTSVVGSIELGASTQAATNDQDTTHLRGFFKQTASGSKTISVRAAKTFGDSSANSYCQAIVDAAASTATTGLLTIAPKTQSFPMPVIANSVISSSTGVEVINRAGVATCAASPCTIASQSGSWLTSIVRNSAGNYTANFATPYLSQPTCIAGSGQNQTALGTVTTTTFNFLTLNTSGTLSDASGINIICMGPK